MRPKVFLGSSGNSLPVVRELERALHPTCDVVPWDSEELFGAGDIILDRLLTLSDKFDFAVMVFGFDDFLVGGDVAVPRDNVLFELGLFMGKLGRRRAFAVVPKMEDKRVKILSDLEGIITLRYDMPPTPEHLRPMLTHVVVSLKASMEATADQISVRIGNTGHLTVQGLLISLEKVVAERMAKSKTVNIQNLGLDMEATWSHVRDLYLGDEKTCGIHWKSLMIDPESAAIRALKSSTVSPEMAATRIFEIQRDLPGQHEAMANRNVQVQVRAYASVPVMHGFLVDGEILFLSFCGIRQVNSPDVPGEFVSELTGSPTAYWQFDMASNPASRYFVSTFAGWFNHVWRNSRPIWPLQPGARTAAL